jgi:hypothetical protein
MGRVKVANTRKTKLLHFEIIFHDLLNNDSTVIRLTWLSNWQGTAMYNPTV